MNKQTILIVSLVFLNLLSSCTSVNNAKEQDSKQEQATIKDSKKTKNLSKSNDDWIKELIIDEKCIWCTKCARIAPDNFAMDFSTLKAVVISQKNILSQEVSRSIQVCPVDSIHIV